MKYVGGSSQARIQSEVANHIVSFVHQFEPEAEEVHRKNGIDVRSISGIVYCRTTHSVRSTGSRRFIHRADLQCDVVAEKLNDSGITASPFYARMPEAQKSRALVDWKDGKISCIVATIAFGMGIDHPHVRYVVHADMPKSFEGYYQETGRCGRDGHRSRCVLFYCTSER